MATDDETPSPNEPAEAPAPPGAACPDAQKAEIQYPAEWGYRIVCTSEEAVRAHLREVLGEIEHELVEGNASSGGTYKSLHLTLIVEDEQHRLHIYEKLSGHDAIRFVI
jgi:putative lipoic acid-binding regulatory protein